VGRFCVDGEKPRRTLLCGLPVRKNAPACFFKRFCSMDKSCAAHRSNRTRRFCVERGTKESAALLCGKENKRKCGAFAWSGKQKKVGRFCINGEKPCRILLHRSFVKSAAPARFFVRLCSMDESCAAHRSNQTRRFCVGRRSRVQRTGVLCAFLPRAPFFAPMPLLFFLHPRLRGRESSARLFCFHAFYPHVFSHAAAFSLRPRLRGVVCGESGLMCGLAYVGTYDARGCFMGGSAACFFFD
jgi:hypothetical protein